MSDRIFGALSAMVALAYIASAAQIQSGFMPDPVGSRLFPMMVGGVGFVCAVLIFLKPGNLLSILCAVLILIAYAYALKPLGFIFPTAVASAVVSFLIQRNLKTAFLTGVGLSIGLFVLFKYALDLGLVAFPKNLIG